ncbi:5'-methylthioadenosine/adenosylhomocysteine nucleosidase [Hutsoniella sourekii]|uniref:5'-methylthioadenosine/adenosylhomocysteine nucleosidase n=1 Tax=Hutsoniella sourekii TaxID=87650 RepID=UPI00048231CF|nr:5'-methylthioadenosine/adenosylhomocysteine nucleosidase [Hutsoniella sourekii]
MKIGIIGAMGEEVRRISNHLINKVSKDHYGSEYISGELGGHSIVLVQSGIGKVNATVTVVVLKAIYQVDAVINTGSAGAIDPGLKVGDVVIADSLIHHDVDVTAFDYQLGQMAGMPEKYHSDPRLVNTAKEACRSLDIEPVIGLIGSGDQFIASSDQVEELANHFYNIRASDMESAAIAQAAYVVDLPFLIIRAISDNANGEAALSFDRFIEFAGDLAAQIVERTINDI